MGLFDRTNGCKKGISLFLFLCSWQIVGASQINEVYVALEETSGNLPDNFTFTFASSNPLAEVTEIAVDLSRSEGGVKFDTAESRSFNVGTGGGFFANYGYDFQVVDNGGVNLLTSLDSDFQKALDGSSYLPGFEEGEPRATLKFSDFTNGKKISFTGDFDRTIPSDDPVVLPEHLAGSLIGARIVSPDTADTVAIGTFSDTGATATALPITDKPGLKALLGSLKKDQPTYVLTHGLQDESTNIGDLWTGFNEGQAGWFISNQIPNANVVQYVWEDAFQVDGLGPEDGEYKKAWQYIPDAGAYLGKELLASLGPDYKESIHFIGHSMGTAVNTYAARLFLNYEDQVESAQFTSLDRPDHIEQIPGFNGILEPFDKIKYRFDSDFFAVNLPTDLDIKIDNYYSLDKTSASGVGDVADYRNGQTLFNYELKNPHEIGDTFFKNESVLGLIDNDHSGVHQWYRWTMDPNNELFTNSSGLASATATLGGVQISGDLRNKLQFCSGQQYLAKLSNLNDSLNPCENGWNISSYALADQFLSNFPAADGKLLTEAVEQVGLLDFLNIGDCNLIGGPATGIACREGSSSFGAAQIDLGATAEYLIFDYLIPSIGVEDFITLFIDDIPVWTVGGESVLVGSLNDSGYIPIRGLTGGRTLTLALNGFGDINAEIEILNLRAVTLEEIASTVPTPTTVALMAIGLFGMRRHRHRHRKAVEK